MVLFIAGIRCDARRVSGQGDQSQKYCHLMAPYPGSQDWSKRLRHLLKREYPTSVGSMGLRSCVLKVIHAEGGQDDREQGGVSGMLST